MSNRTGLQRALTRRRGLQVAAGILISGTLVAVRSVPAQAFTGAAAGQLGVSIDGTSLLFSTPADRARNLDRLASMGASWLRLDIAASQLTWAQGRYNWAALDEIVAGANSRGINVLGALSGVPSYARPADSQANLGPQNQAQVDAFAGFAGDVARRYSGKIAAWEIWGEANRVDTWAPSPSPSWYSNTLRATRATLDSIDPQTVVILGGAGGATRAGDVDAVTWLEQLYAHGAKDGFEAVGAHAWIGGSGLGAINLSDDLRRVQAANGDSKPLWWTMVGIPSGGSAMQSEQSAAQTLAQVAQRTSGQDFGPTIFYTLNDLPQDTAAARMGFYRADGVAKETLTAFRAAAKSATAVSTVTPTVTSPAVAALVASTTQGQAAQTTGVAVTGTSLLYASTAKREQDLDRIAASGGRWLRLDIAASQVTWANSGQYEWWRVDAVVEAARRRNLKILGVLSGVPQYDRPSGTSITYGPTTNGERASFARFAEAAASRYKGTVDNWEIWNEPNLKAYWTPAPNAGAYAALLAMARNRIKAVNPSAVVVSGGTGGAGASSADVDAFAWLNQLYANGLAANSDAVGVHLYTHPYNKNLGEFLRLDAYRSLLDRHGDAGKQLWATEAGGSSGGASPVSEALGADFLEQQVQLWLQLPNHGPLLFYTLYDEGGSDFYGYLGLLHQDGSPKLAYTRMQQVTQR